MANRLFELFGDSTKSGKDLITSTPKSLSDLTGSGQASPEGIQTKLDLMYRVVPKIDYSDFSKFVFFNSALDYFNICGDRLIREYPYDGTYDDVLAFQSRSDNFENFLLNDWPHWSGTFHFVSGAYSTVNESLGVLAPGTGSFTVEFHISPQNLPGTNQASVVLQRLPATGSSEPSYTVFLSTNNDNSSSINLHVSGATTSTFSYPIAHVSGAGYYVGWSVDTTSGIVQIFITDPEVNEFRFQDLTNHTDFAWSSSFSSNFSGSSIFRVGAGVLPTGVTGTLVASDFYMSELRVWHMARNADDIHSSYNTRVWKDEPLKLYWRFAEPYLSDNGTMITRDYSGNKLDGRISNGQLSYWVPSTNWAGGFGMSGQDKGEPLLSIRSQEVIDYVTAKQNTAEEYDRGNQNIITNLVPQQFFYLEDERNTEVLKNLLYVLGRQFDELKVYIDQFSKILVADLSEYNTTPDALLDEVLQFWGWDTKGNFLNKEAFQWFFGYNVIDRTPDDIDQNVYNNERLDKVLYDIKNEFWRRTLNNLPYIYKTKGTRESVESLFRIYGLDKSVIKLKEYGLKPFVKIETNRINSVKSADAFRSDPISGTYSISTYGQPIELSDMKYTVGMQIMFPHPNSFYPTSAGPDVPTAALPPTVSTGTIFYLSQTPTDGGTLAAPIAFPLGGDFPTGTLQPVAEGLYYTRSTASLYGNICFSASDGVITFDGLRIFDNTWYNLTLRRSGSHVDLSVQFLDTDRTGTMTIDSNGLWNAIPYLSEASIIPTLSQSGYSDFILAYGLTGSQGQFHARNVMVWSDVLTESEILDHTLNPFSHGADTPERHQNLQLNWQFDELTDSDTLLSITSSVVSRYFDSSQYGNHGYLNGDFGSWASKLNGVPLYKRFNFSYNFIAPPDYGWNEEKIRSFDTSKPPEGDHWNEINDVALEFNLIDALNEDISYMMSTMNNWNNVIGDPANRYRDTYPTLDKLRQQYFARLSNRINFRAFADFLDFFDRSFVDMVGRLLPARADFKGAEFVVESHMLERPKVQYNYRRQSPQLVPEGQILIYGHEPIRLAGTMAVDPGSPTINAGESLQFTASFVTPIFKKNITTSSFWTSSDETVATVDQNGLATSVPFSGGVALTEWAGTWTLLSENVVKDQTFEQATSYQFNYAASVADYMNWIEIPRTDWGEGITRVMFVKRAAAPDAYFAVGNQDQDIISPMEDVSVTMMGSAVVGVTSTVLFLQSIGQYYGNSETTPVGPFSLLVQGTSVPDYMTTSSFYVDRHWRVPS